MQFSRWTALRTYAMDSSGDVDGGRGGRQGGRSEGERVHGQSKMMAR